MKIILMLFAAQLPQPQAAPPATPVIVGQRAPSNVLLSGTEIRLRTLTELSSKQSRVGDRFNLEVSEPVMLNGQTAIPAGSSATGEVTKVVKKGMFGKSGKLYTRLVSVRIGDQQIRIRGEVGDRGKGGTAATIGSMVVIPVAGFFVTGTSALLPPGSSATGYLESDLPVVFADTNPAPIIIQAAQPTR